jgi:hypothetical protein
MTVLIIWFVAPPGVNGAQWFSWFATPPNGLKCCSWRILNGYTYGIMKILFSLLFVFSSYFSCTRNGQSELHFDLLLCEYAEQPIHVFNPNPRFTWVIKADAAGTKANRHTGFW